MINKDTHTRFWVTLMNEDFELLSEAAKELNLSVSAYAGQIVAEHLHKGKSDKLIDSSSTNIAKSPAVLNKVVTTALAQKDNGDKFTIRGLFSDDDWVTMSRSEKAIAAKILASIERNSEELEIIGQRNKTSVYRKLERR